MCCLLRGLDSMGVLQFHAAFLSTPEICDGRPKPDADFGIRRSPNGGCEPPCRQELLQNGSQ